MAEAQALAIEQGHELVDQLRVELATRHPPHLGDRLRRGQRRAVGVAGDHDVVGVGDRDDPREQRDRLAGQAMRVALAVPALVVAEDDLRHRRVGLHARDDAGALLRVAAHDLPVLLGQRRGREQDRVGERELADVVQQPGRVDEVLLVARAAVRLGERAGVARDGGGVAGGHAVAHRERVDHARQHPELQRRELLRAPLRAQQLAQHVLEHEQHEREQRERRQPRLAVDDRHAHGQQRARQLDGQHRDEDLAHLAAQRDPRVGRDVDGDHREVEREREHERAEHDERERDVVGLEVGDARERLDAEPDDERDHRVGRHVGEHLVRREAVAQRVDEHRDDADQHRRRRPAQRHREHEREERAGDALRAVLERDQVADHREREQDRDEPERLPVLGLGRHGGGDERAEEDRGLRDGEPSPAGRHAHRG